jgi:hypothetical protein
MPTPSIFADCMQPGFCHSKSLSLVFVRSSFLARIRIARSLFRHRATPLGDESEHEQNAQIEGLLCMICRRITKASEKILFVGDCRVQAE